MVGSKRLFKIQLMEGIGVVIGIVASVVVGTVEDVEVAVEGVAASKVEGVVVGIVEGVVGIVGIVLSILVVDVMVGMVEGVGVAGISPLWFPDEIATSSSKERESISVPDFRRLCFEYQ